MLLKNLCIYLLVQYGGIMVDNENDLNRTFNNRIEILKGNNRLNVFFKEYYYCMLSNKVHDNIHVRIKEN